MRRAESPEGGGVAGRHHDAGLLGQHAEGTIWPVDAGLRPEGKAGPLVRTLASHVAYYERWAKTWEFQALLKARPVAGDLELGQDYLTAVAPMVWQAADRPDFVSDVQQMRRRVESTLRRRRATASSSWGRAGCATSSSRSSCCSSCTAGPTRRCGAPTRWRRWRPCPPTATSGAPTQPSSTARTASCARSSTASSCTACVAPTSCPTTTAELRRLGRSLGLRTAPVEELDAEWRRHAREVRRLHEKLFYRPLLSSVARLASDEARLTPEAARARLEALGYVDPAGALRHLESLSEGVSRRAAIQRTLLPVLLGWFADAPDPDGGLLAFRRLSDTLGTTPWYLRLLRDEGAVAQRLALLLASSRYAVDLLARAPDAVRMLADDEELVPRTRAELGAELSTMLARHDDPETAAGLARGVRRRELFRLAAADLLGVVDVEQVEQSLTDVAAATLQAALDVSVRSVEATRGGPLPTRLAVIGDGPAGRSGDVLRQRRRRALRARPAPRGRRARGVGGGARGGGRAAPVAVGALARPAARRRRRAATRGPPGSPGAQPRVVRRLLRALVARLGEPGAAACRPGRR